MKEKRAEYLRLLENKHQYVARNASSRISRLHDRFSPVEKSKKEEGRGGRRGRGKAKLASKFEWKNVDRGFISLWPSFRIPFRTRISFWTCVIRIRNIRFLCFRLPGSFCRMQKLEIEDEPARYHVNFPPFSYFDNLFSFCFWRIILEEIERPWW